jgi:cytochrome c biogenesis protein CcdA
MAEWALLILILAVVASTYAVSRFLYETWQVVLAWVVAALIIAVGLVVYGMSKGSEMKKNWTDHYYLDEQL